jgi:predicted transcriptional regulator
MATAVPVSRIAQIGDTAGTVWQILSQNGPLSMTRLVEEVGEKHDAVMQALGWLAREDKIWIEREGRKRIVSLREFL